jgi:hypothetical protein
MDEKLDKLEEMSETSSEIAHSWNTAHENLLAAIADRANCYRWLHSKCHASFDFYNFYLTIPSIVISAVTGSATIGLTSIFDAESQRGASIGIGLLTLMCGALTSVNQFMKTSQFAEAHRAAAIAYGKLHRVISSELALRRDQRLNALDFLKVVRTEQDRLQETSPEILDSAKKLFRIEFSHNTELEKPEIVGDLDHVQVNRSMKQDGVTPTAPRMTLYHPPSVYHAKTARITPSQIQSSLTEPLREDIEAGVPPEASPCPTTGRDRAAESLPQSVSQDQHSC